MKICNFTSLFTFCIFGLFVFSVKAFSAIDETAANKYKTISAMACDSLIKANDKNPEFVILDVRTPSTWLADHLTGSFCRNYYDADFSVQLNALPKNKIYLLHCQSGGRSAPTLTIMKSQNFAEVYEMSGGINAWKSALLKTTNLVAPRLMLVSNGGTKKGTVQYGLADTLKITLTNRANDTLRFTSFTIPAGNEFSSNFDLKRKLKGTEDYTFSVYYKPQQVSVDSVKIGIKSNGGDLSIKIILQKGIVQEVPVISRSAPKIYPNPASEFISFENFSGTSFSEVSLINLNGQMVKRESDFQAVNQLSLSNLPEGIYFVRIISGTQTFVGKLVLSR